MPCWIKSISVLIMLHKTRENSSLLPGIIIGAQPHRRKQLFPQHPRVLRFLWLPRPQQVYHRRYHRHRVSQAHPHQAIRNIRPPEVRSRHICRLPTAHLSIADERQSTNGPGPANPAGSQASRNSNTHYRDSLLNTNVRQLPDTVIIGTSLVRGVSSNLHKRNIDNVSYCYPGAEIPTIRSRINSVLPRNSRPRQVFLQAGGNDLESHPTDQVIKQFDKLIHQVKSRCSKATTILLGRIPPRRHPALTDEIKKVNTYLNNRGMRGDNVKFVDCCPSFPSQFSRDRVHFNSEGAKVYADKLACHAINFQLPGINVRC